MSRYIHSGDRYEPDKPKGGGQDAGTGSDATGHGEGRGTGDIEFAAVPVLEPDNGVSGLAAGDSPGVPAADGGPEAVPDGEPGESSRDEDDEDHEESLNRDGQDKEADSTEDSEEDAVEDAAEDSAEDAAGDSYGGDEETDPESVPKSDEHSGQQSREESGNDSEAVSEDSGEDDEEEQEEDSNDEPEAAEEDSDGEDGENAGRGDMEASEEFGENERKPDHQSWLTSFFFGNREQEETSADEGDEEQETGGNARENEEEGAGNKEDKSSRQKKRDREMSNSIEESVRYWKGDDRVPESLGRTRELLTEVMGLGTSFDIVFREMSFGGTKAGLLFISGFAKDIILDEILKRLTYLNPDHLSSDALAAFMNEYIPHIQVEKVERLSEAISKSMAGMSALFVEGETSVIVMDTRAYPSRSPDEPSIERVVRGSRDGFTETLLSNVALVRRRLRDPGLTFEIHQVGRRTITDVAVAYIDDIVDKAQVKAVTEKIMAVNIEGIPLADKQLEEAIIGKGWSPYPMVRYSERPDVVASHLLEGRVVVFVDTSPSVMVIPTTFFDLCQHAEENRQTPLIGSYLRWVRFVGILASIFLLPLWMLFVIHPELKPTPLAFIGPHEMAKIPLIAQFLLIEFGVDLLRMAAVHTPTPLGSAMGLIAAILIGDIAVQTGLFVNEVVLYMAVATIGMFATPSYELGLANRVVRLFLLVVTGIFHVPGFVIGSTLLIVMLTLNRSYNSSYLWPFIPFNAKAMGSILFRKPVLSTPTRPSFNKTRDNTRMDPGRRNKDKS